MSTKVAEETGEKRKSRGKVEVSDDSLSQKALKNCGNTKEQLLEILKGCKCNENSRVFKTCFTKKPHTQYDGTQVQITCCISCGISIFDHNSSAAQIKHND